MIDEGTEGILKIAEKHVAALQSSMNDIATNYPFSVDFIINQTTDEFRILETMTARFGKLQDLLGTKIIDLYLQSQAQPIAGLSMLDKIHKLEKFYIIDDEDLWAELRRTRNHIAHEYPDKPELAAKYLNTAYALAPKLIEIYRKLAAEIRREG